MEKYLKYPQSVFNILIPAYDFCTFIRFYGALVEVVSLSDLFALKLQNGVVKFSISHWLSQSFLNRTCRIAC